MTAVNRHMCVYMCACAEGRHRANFLVLSVLRELLLPPLSIACIYFIKNPTQWRVEPERKVAMRWAGDAGSLLSAHPEVLHRVPGASPAPTHSWGTGQGEKVLGQNGQQSGRSG